MPNAPHLQDLETIRIIAALGRGHGHQRAALVTMEKLRELGFRGTFDLVYHESPYHEKYRQPGSEKFCITRKFRTLLPEFPDLSIEDTGSLYSVTKEFETPSLGKVKCTREAYLPGASGKPEPPEPERASLTVYPGRYSESDSRYEDGRYCDYFLALQPCDWLYGRQFVRNYKDGGTEHPLENDLLHSAASSHIKERPPENALTASENALIDICANNAYISQLAYGIYDDALNRIKTIIAQGKEAATKYGKPLIIILPQQNLFTAKEKTAIQDEHRVIFTDVEDIQHRKHTGNNGQHVFLLETGPLSQKAFDFLLIKGTELPPCIEGAAAKSLCKEHERTYCDMRHKYQGLFLLRQPRKPVSEEEHTSPERVYRPDKVTEALDILGIGYSIGANIHRGGGEPEKTAAGTFEKNLQESRKKQSVCFGGLFSACFGQGTKTDERSR